LSEILATAQKVIAEGTSAVAKLNQQITQLEKEKAELKQVQTTLTSGLIGAVVTALVAIAGAIFKPLGSRVERDLKRLEVVEKVAALQVKRIAVPPDIVQTYETKRPD
jgi:hypothetical protein